MSLTYKNEYEILAQFPDNNGPIPNPSYLLILSRYKMDTSKTALNHFQLRKINQKKYMSKLMDITNFIQRGFNVNMLANLVLSTL